MLLHGSPLDHLAGDSFACRETGALIVLDPSSVCPACPAAELALISQGRPGDPFSLGPWVVGLQSVNPVSEAGQESAEDIDKKNEPHFTRTSAVDLRPRGTGSIYVKHTQKII